MSPPPPLVSAMKTVAALLALAAAAAAAAHPASLAAQWTVTGQSPAEAQVAFSVHLPFRNLAQLDETFWAVSTPGKCVHIPHWRRASAGTCPRTPAAAPSTASS